MNAICATCRASVPIGDAETDLSYVDAWAHALTHEVG